MTVAGPRHTVVVGALVRNGSGGVLLIRHRRRGWEIPQGRVEEGENLVEAVSVAATGGKGRCSAG